MGNQRGRVGPEVDGCRYRVYNVDMSSYLGDFELLALLATLRVGDDAYAVPIRREIEAAAERRVSRGALYTTLRRLEDKGYLQSWTGDATPERGGRPRRFYSVTPAGLEAVRASRRALTRLWRGLGPVLGTAAGGSE